MLTYRTFWINKKCNCVLKNYSSLNFAQKLEYYYKNLQNNKTIMKIFNEIIKVCKSL